MTKKIVLKYIGWGFLPGIPARDLSAEDVERYSDKDALIATGLYAEPEKPKRKAKVAIVEADTED